MKKSCAFFLVALAIGAFNMPVTTWAQASSAPAAVSQEKQSEGSKTGKMIEEPEHGKAYAEQEARWRNPWEKERFRRGARPGWYPRRYAPRSAMSEITGDFHFWLECLMAERRDLCLSPEQSGQLDKALTQYSKGLIESEAAALSAMVQLKYDLRQPRVDMSSVQTELKAVSDHEYAIQLSAIKTYQSILDILTPAQRQQIDESIGSAFPSMWHSMSRWESWKAGARHEGWESERHEKERD